MINRRRSPSRHRQKWWIGIVAAAIGLPLVVVMPVLTVLLLIIFIATALVVRDRTMATTMVAASIGLLIPVVLYLALALLR